jgi:hypothetical protein
VGKCLPLQSNSLTLHSSPFSASSGRKDATWGLATAAIGWCCPLCSYCCLRPNLNLQRKMRIFSFCYFSLEKKTLFSPAHLPYNLCSQHALCWFLNFPTFVPLLSLLPSPGVLFYLNPVYLSRSDLSSAEGVAQW